MLLGFLSRKLLITTADALFSSPHLGKPTYPRLFATATIRFAKQHNDEIDADTVSSTTVTYLVDSCGLSMDAAKRAANRFRLESADTADSVLALLKQYGFSDSNISTIVQKRPVLLLADPEKILRPKFECLASLGGSTDVILKVVLRCPEMLFRNMEEHLVPSLEFLRSILQTDENVLLVIGRCHWLLKFNLPAILGPNVQSLRDVGMSEAMILLFLKSRPTALLSSATRFREVTFKVMEMGFDPDKYSFFEATNVYLSVNKKTWERKVELFKKWGWSDTDVVSAFKKQPRSMLQSDKKVEGIMNYLVNTMELDPSFTAQTPNVLMCSLKKRIIPRCSVIKHLLLNGVIARNDFKFSSALVVSEPLFINVYVTRHKDAHPELLGIYKMHKEGVQSDYTAPV